MQVDLKAHCLIASGMGDSKHFKFLEEESDGERFRSILVAKRRIIKRLLAISVVRSQLCFISFVCLFEAFLQPLLVLARRKPHPRTCWDQHSICKLKSSWTSQAVCRCLIILLGFPLILAWTGRYSDYSHSNLPELGMEAALGRACHWCFSSFRPF